MSWISRGAGKNGNALNPDWLDKAFGLAYFIHICLDDETQRRSVARKIMEEALRRLPVMAKEQQKRYYYMMKGRSYQSAPDDKRAEASETAQEDDYKGKARSKINLEELHLLQFLVFEISREEEKNQEKASSGVPLNQEDMLVRYLAYVVGTTMGRNSFYVNLGLCRLVYNYSAGQTEELYRLLTQDNINRSKGGEYFRKQKGELRKELLNRFDGYLKLKPSAPGGTQKFQTVADPHEFSELLSDCFREFQPWDHPCCLPEDFKGDNAPQLCFDGRKADDSDIEMNRIHSVIHPDCFAKLVRAKEYAEPAENLELPLFSLNGHCPEG